MTAQEMTNVPDPEEDRLPPQDMPSEAQVNASIGNLILFMQKHPDSQHHSSTED